MSKKKEEYLEKRVIHQKLSKQVIEGNEYKESAAFKTKDGQEYEVLIRALGGGEIAECFIQGQVPLSDLQSEADARKISWENLITQCHLIAQSMTNDKGERFDPEWIKRHVDSTCGGELSAKILNLSYGKKADIESFHSQPV